MSDRAGPFDRILASLHEAALVPGLVLPRGTEGVWARATVKPVSDPGRTMRDDLQKTGERR